MERNYIINMFQAVPPYFLMNIMQTEPGFTLEYHSHDKYHINLITQGSVLLETRDTKTMVHSGFAFIMPPGVEHRLYSEKGYIQTGADVSVSQDGYDASSILAELSCGKAVKFPAENPAILDWITEEALCDPSPYAAVKCANAMDAFIIGAAENHRKESNFRTEFISAVNGAAGCSLEYLCRVMSCSKTKLERQVNREFGCGAMEYVGRMRFAKVCRLLISTEEPLYMIAERCGFYDSAHLSVFFKKRCGISPITYRQECKNLIHIHQQKIKF